MKDGVAQWSAFPHRVKRKFALAGMHGVVLFVNKSSLDSYSRQIDNLPFLDYSIQLYKYYNRRHTNSGYSLVVTHRTFSPPVHRLVAQPLITFARTSSSFECGTAGKH
jgi:hypothetical protein